MSRHDPITQAQLDLIRALARQVDVPISLVEREADTQFLNSDLDRINRGEASALIQWLTDIRDGHAPRPITPGQLALFGGEGLR